MKLVLGIEFGSTRIKSVLVNENAEVLSKGEYCWTNVLVDGLWSYSMDEVFVGLRASYKDLVKNYGKSIEKLDAIGISGMMHGYLAFDENDNLLVPFRTWRNTNTNQAATELSELFKFNVPMRWSVAQYYQSVLDGLPHVKSVKHLTTLSGYIHYRLTGERILGIGDASGMFPIDNDKHYDREMLKKFDTLLVNNAIDSDFESLLPTIKLAGENAGYLTEEGAMLIDESGILKGGCPMCAPEGDMGTGMICTNTVIPKTANASLGTSANLTVILDENLRGYYPEIDVIETPDGNPAALIHTNTCTSIIDSWVNVFNEVIGLVGAKIDKGELYSKLFNISTQSDANVGNIACYNYLAGEPIAKTSNGVPMLFYSEDGKLNLANFMQAQIYSAISTLSLGLEILNKEGVEIQSVFGHGGYFKTELIGQNALSALVKAPVTVMQNASEGGAWGIAILALYSLSGRKSLSEYLDNVFKNNEKVTVMASLDDERKFDEFIKNYKSGLTAERALCEKFKKLQ